MSELLAPDEALALASRIARHSGVDHDDADDAVGDTMLWLVRNRQLPWHEGTVVKVTRNKVRDIHRRRSRWYRYAVSMDSHEAATVTVEGVTEPPDTDIEQQLATLPRLAWTVAHV